jgi:hypothetical protein
LNRYSCGLRQCKRNCHSYQYIICTSCNVSLASQLHVLHNRMQLSAHMNTKHRVLVRDRIAECCARMRSLGYKPTLCMMRQLLRWTRF